MTCPTNAAEFRLAIVGGGPRSTYALERLAASIHRWPGQLRLDIFDPSGAFGAGWVHTWDQPPFAFLNRTSEEISFSADSSVTAARDIRPGAQEDTLATWVDQHEVPTLQAPTGRWLPRSVHGLALKAAFEAHVDQLRHSGRVDVHLHPHEVVGISSEDAQLLLRTSTGEVVPVDHALLVTGHAPHDPLRVPEQACLLAAAAASTSTVIASPYPLGEGLSEDAVAPGSDVVLRGTGLVAVDVVLHLTLGRGGRFVAGRDDVLVYEPSGREPGSVHAVSSSGIFPFARPAELSQTSPFIDSGNGRFLTRDALRRLRATYGRGERQRLDFDLEVLPIVILEMAHQYYSVGESGPVADAAARSVQAAYDAFLDGRVVEHATDLADAYVDSRRWAVPAFSWAWLCDPAASIRLQGKDRQAALAQHIEDDVEESWRGVRTSGLKAATSGVWRELRPLIAAAVDDGGLTIESARRFRSLHHRLHNRFANGPAPEVMRMMAALQRAGVLHLARGGGVVPGEHRLSVECDGSLHDTDHVVEAYLPPFHPDTTRTSLYRHMRDAGLLRLTHDGVDITPDHHPIGTGGFPDERLTILGPTLEGSRAFQISALRPQCDHEVMRNIVDWLDQVMDEVASRSAHSNPVMKETVPS